LTPGLAVGSSRRAVEPPLCGPDPLLGGSSGKSHFTIPADPVRIRLTEIPTVVTNLGGGYFFLPSRSALARIAAG
jgi:hypothetical protein